jgi:hypothetical protein
MSELVWPVGAALILGAAHVMGGMVLLIVVAVAMTWVFKVLGDSARRR